MFSLVSVATHICTSDLAFVSNGMILLPRVCMSRASYFGRCRCLGAARQPVSPAGALAFREQDLKQPLLGHVLPLHNTTRPAMAGLFRRFSAESRLSFPIVYDISYPHVLSNFMLSPFSPRVLKIVHVKEPQFHLSHGRI
ncbi:hypothetical protein V2G26_009151 [Clonostachys chloroleuca]